MIIRKPLLVENVVLDQGKSLGLWKPSLVKRLSLFEENFLEEGKILTCERKLPP